MNIKDRVEKGLAEYKENESIIETTLERIEVYQELLDSNKEVNLFTGHNKELGMPRSSGVGDISIVELKVMDKEKQRDILRQWIKDDKSRIYPLQIEREQISMALEALTDKERYIVDCKYFKEMFWREIEHAFNDKFTQQNMITESGLKQMFYESRSKLIRILKPYYQRFG